MGERQKKKVDPKMAVFRHYLGMNRFGKPGGHDPKTPRPLRFIPAIRQATPSWKTLEPNTRMVKISQIWQKNGSEVAKNLYELRGYLVAHFLP